MKAVKWERKPLGTVADLCLGKMLDQNKNRGEPLPYLANVNVRWGEFALDDLRTMRFEPKEMDRYGLRLGDIVMCEGGEPGRCAIWKDQIPGMMIQKALHRIRPTDILDYRFLFYSFLHIGHSKGFDQYFTGATIKHLPGEKLAKVEVDVPPLPVQQRIVGILSAYDEFIENNQRRIRILEEMARTLYREWFVYFRFPGHEAVDFVETQFGRVPVGWVLPFADHVDFKEGPGLRNWQYRNEGLPFLNIRTLVDNDIDLSKVQFLDPKEVEEKYQHFLLREHDHVVSSSGTIGRIVTIRTEHLPLMLNTSIIRMRPLGQRIGCWQLKHFLLHDYFQNQAKSFATGAAQANFGPIHLKQMQIIAPSERIAAEYERLVAPVEFAIMSLARRNQNLRRTRDLLLPRLLSGEVSLARATAKPIEDVSRINLW